MHPSKEIVKMYEGKKQYYHALDRACIDSLDCDIMELFKPPDDFTHVYGDSGRWFGIARK